MIQRIQTFYLTISLILMGLVGTLPLGEIASGVNIYTFSIKGFINSANNSLIFTGLPLLALLSVILALNIAVIFNFKKRKLQVRLTTISMMVMIVLLFMSWYTIHSSLKIIGNGVFSMNMAMSFPLVSVILNYLALRAIRRDEALVRSIDRIR